jgi:peptide/nickel transport system substrate-binding protein
VATNYWRRVAKQRVGRRRILQGTAALSLSTAALSLIGCGGDDDDSGGGTAGTATGSTGGDAGEPKPGGTVRFGLTSDLTNLEPHVFILAHRDTINQVWDPLTHYDENLEPQAQLAQSWEINPDYTEISLKLRPGVKYHSGRDFTSEDVKFNFDRVRAEGTAFGQLRAMSSMFDSLETPDPMTVVLKSSSPRPTVFDFLENWLMGDKDTLGTENTTTAVGTGAFMLGEWRPGDRFNLRKNPNYWQSGKPLLDEQIYQVSLDPQTMVSQFEAEELDVAIRPLFRDFARYSDDSDFQTMVQRVPGQACTPGAELGPEPRVLLQDDLV